MKVKRCVEMNSKKGKWLLGKTAVSAPGLPWKLAKACCATAIQQARGEACNLLRKLLQARRRRRKKGRGKERKAKSWVLEKPVLLIIPKIPFH